MPRAKRLASSQAQSSYAKKAKQGRKYMGIVSKPSRYRVKYGFRGFARRRRPVQNRTYQELQTVRVGSLTGDGARLAGEIAFLNSAYDPCNAAGAVQPQGWDAITPALYDRYKVWSGRWHIKIIPKAATNPRKCTIVLWVSRSNVDVTSLRAALEQLGAKSRVFTIADVAAPDYNNQQPLTMSGSWDLQDWFGSPHEVDYNIYTSSPNTGLLHVLYLNYLVVQTDDTVIEDTYPVMDYYLTINQHTELIRRTGNFIAVS